MILLGTWNIGLGRVSHIKMIVVVLRRFILFSNRFKNNNIKQKIFRYIFKQITSIQEDYIHIFKQIYI